MKYPPWLPESDTWRCQGAAEPAARKCFNGNPRDRNNTHTRGGYFIFYVLVCVCVCVCVCTTGCAAGADQRASEEAQHISKTMIQWAAIALNQEPYWNDLNRLANERRHVLYGRFEWHSGTHTHTPGVELSQSLSIRLFLIRSSFYDSPFDYDRVSISKKSVLVAGWLFFSSDFTSFSAPAVGTPVQIAIRASSNSNPSIFFDSSELVALPNNDTWELHFLPCSSTALCYSLQVSRHKLPNRTNAVFLLVLQHVFVQTTILTDFFRRFIGSIIKMLLFTSIYEKCVKPSILKTGRVFLASNEKKNNWSMNLLLYLLEYQKRISKSITCKFCCKETLQANATNTQHQKYNNFAWAGTLLTESRQMVSIYCEWWKTYPMHTHTHKYFLLPEDAFNWRYPFSLRQFKNPKKEARKFRENVIHLEGPVTHWTIGCVFLNSFPFPPLRTPKGKIEFIMK